MAFFNLPVEYLVIHFLIASFVWLCLGALVEIIADTDEGKKNLISLYLCMKVSMSIKIMECTVSIWYSVKKMA